MESMQYFGYGSLVNRDTRPDDERFESVRVNGWQRLWGHRVADVAAVGVPVHRGSTEYSGQAAGYSVLTVEPAEGAEIFGVQVPISATDLPSLDERERGYSRQMLNSTKSTDPVAMYVSNPEHVAMASNDYPLLQSYVDCVLAGYLTLYGWDGVNKFIASTKGWSAPMLADRDGPLYPRAVTSARDVLADFDRLVTTAHFDELELP